MKKKYIVIMIIIVLLVIGGCVGVFMYQGTKEDKPTSTKDTTEDVSELTKTEEDKKTTEKEASTEKVSTATTEEEKEDMTTEENGVIVYQGNDDADGYDKEQIIIEDKSPESIMEELVKNKVIPEDIKIINFSQDGTSLTLDLSSEFQTYMYSVGDAEEVLSIGSIVNTYLSAYEATEITILIDGKSWESGHAVYDAPMGRYK